MRRKINRQLITIAILATVVTMALITVVFRQLLENQIMEDLKSYAGLLIQADLYQNTDIYVPDFKSGNVQVLLGIKCLDEGIDIPNARIAIIMSSSINNINIMNKLGITPAIVNQLKKFSCKKYVNIAIKIKIIWIVNFFNFSSYYSFVITNTEFNLLKSTAVSIIAYLSVILLVVTISLTVPIIIPFGYIPPTPDV